MRLKFGSSLLECWRHHFAGPAPRRPEIDDNRDVTAADMFLKTRIGQLGRMAIENLFTAPAAFRARGEAVSRQTVGRTAARADNVFRVGHETGCWPYTSIFKGLNAPYSDDLAPQHLCP
jgi:hypothetical protein